MEDFDALAALLGAGISDLRGCLILSHDGLVLGAHPRDAEDVAKPAWLRMSALGEPERGFVQFGTEIWCFVRRGPYAGFALSGSGTGVRPGLVLDQMDQALLAAQEARTKGFKLDASAGTPPAPAPSGKPRTTLHPEAKPVDEPVVIHADAPAAEGAGARPDTRSKAVSEGAMASPGGAPEPSRATDDGDNAGPESGDAPSETPGEVDRISLAREFSQLLQDHRDGADG